MSTITNLNNNSGAARTEGVNPIVPNRGSIQRAGDDATVRSADSVDISSRARELSEKLTLTNPIRQDLVARVRSAIEAGTYETDDKIDAAAEQILRDANGII